MTISANKSTVAATMLLAFCMPGQIVAQYAASSSTARAFAMTPTEQRAASELVEDANRDRSPHSLPPLHEDLKLTEAALRHAWLMVRSGTLTHQVPGEPGLIVRIQQAGVRCNTVAENVAEAPTADQINYEWMHSSAHRANLLDARVNTIGIAVVKVRGELYAVEDFAHELQSMSGEQQEQQVASLLRARGLQAQIGGDRVHRYCGGTPSRQRPLPKLVMRYSTTDLSRLPAQVEQGIRSGSYRRAVVGACGAANENGFAAYQMVVLLY